MGRASKPAARVEMRSPASGGTALVPQGRVKEFQSNGWRTVEAKASKPATKKAAKTADDEK